METTVVLSTLIAVIVCNCATVAASSQPWLSALSFNCRDSDNHCVGVVLDRYWVLTTANCFSQCKTEIPTQISVHVNIPPEYQKKIELAISMGNKVNGTLAWQHPEYDSKIFANNLALVKLDCHDHALQGLNLASNCNSADESQESNFNGYMLLKNTAIKIKTVDGYKVECFSGQGTATWYYNASTLQVIATKSRSDPNCMETLICKDTEELKYFMQGNEPNCTLSPTGAPANNIFMKNISTQHTVTSVVMPTLKASEILTSTQVVISSTQAPIPTKIGSTPSQVQASTITSTPISVKMDASTEAPTILPTPTSTDNSISIQVSYSTVIPSTHVPIATPIETNTSGCQLNISNGETHAATIIPGFILITYTCNPGYNFEVGVMQITYGCTNGVMSSKPLPCKLITCPPIEPFANGTVAVSGLTIDSTAKYSCNDGFILSGGYTVRVCGADHQWSGNAGVCKRVCSFPDPLVCNDGHKIYATTLRYGQIGESTSYKVTDGYYLIGEAPVCQPDSTWSAPPKCIKLCNESQVYPNATVLIQRNATTYTRKIECSEGYKAIGATSKSGVWNPYFQECAKTCGQISLVNGVVSMYESASFIIAIMECDEGFHLYPELSAVRCSNAKWVPGIPSCVENEET